PRCLAPLSRGQRRGLAPRLALRFALLGALARRVTGRLAPLATLFSSLFLALAPLGAIRAGERADRQRDDHPEPPRAERDHVSVRPRRAASAKPSALRAWCPTPATSGSACPRRSRRWSSSSCPPSPGCSAGSSSAPTARRASRRRAAA